MQAHLKECYSMPKIGRIFSGAELDELIQESSLTTKTSQMRHLKRHVRSYPCEQCDKSLTSKHGLKKHVNSKHRGIRVNCDYKACQTTFSSIDAKRFHIKVSTKSKSFPVTNVRNNFQQNDVYLTTFLIFTITREANVKYVTKRSQIKNALGSTWCQHTRVEPSNVINVTKHMHKFLDWVDTREKFTKESHSRVEFAVKYSNKNGP